MTVIFSLPYALPSPHTALICSMCAVAASSACLLVPRAVARQAVPELGARPILVPLSCLVFLSAPTLFSLPLASPAAFAAFISSRHAVAAFECVLAYAAGVWQWCPGYARVQPSPAPRSIHSARARARLSRMCMSRVLLGERSRCIEFLHRFARTTSIFRAFGIHWNCLRYL